VVDFGSIPFKAAKPKGPTGVTISRRLAEQTLGKTRFSSFSASEDYHQRPRNFAIHCFFEEKSVQATVELTADGHVIHSCSIATRALHQEH